MTVEVRFDLALGFSHCEAGPLVRVRFAGCKVLPRGMPPLVRGLRVQSGHSQTREVTSSRSSGRNDREACSWAP